MSKYTTTLNTTPPPNKIPRTIAQRRASSLLQQRRRRLRPLVQQPVKPVPATSVHRVSLPVMPHHYAKTDTVNAAGGKAFRKSPAFELLSLVFCALLSARKTPKFYESEASVISRLRALVQAQPLFAAQAALWARRVLGLRSISHAVAAMVCYYTKGQGLPWVRQFVQAVVFRPDDAIEVIAAYFHFFGNGKSIRKPGGKKGKRVPVTLPYPLKKGIASALSELDGYQLAKYQKTSQAISLVDVFNLVHPRPSAENGQAFRDFVRGELKNTDTWEARLSAAGGDRIKKEEAWCSLIEERKLGYLAALRNIRNILEQAPGAVDALLGFIRNPTAVARSLVLPFQFARAYKEVGSCGLPRATEAAAAIQAAVELSCKNIPVLPGRTLVALDESGSMGEPSNDSLPAGVGALFAAVLLKSQPGADYLSFSDTARYKNVNPTSPLFEVVTNIHRDWRRGSTNFHSIFTSARERYDNIIILSDGEGWVMGERWDQEAGAPTVARRQYEEKFKVLPFIVMFDLTGEKTMMFPEDSVAILSGFSDKVFTLLRELRRNPTALIDEVAATNFADVNEGDKE